MKIYLVGGAVRDHLLGREVTERDFVVVGATPEELLSLGFRSVGNDFPVFLHPQTHEEYALARTERKIGKGYTGFECFADPTVTLEDDLLRRDLTINAMAQECEFSGIDLVSVSKTIIDPHNGQGDLKNKILRHVSEAFSEDPVRILRIARFAARFADFNVHSDTNQLMQEMVSAGEVNALVSERVWKEFSRALSEENPNRFFSVLTECHALPILFPEFAKNPACFDYLDRGIHNEFSQALLEYIQRTLDQSEISRLMIELRFGMLTLGLNNTDIISLCQRLRPPSTFSNIALLVSTHRENFLTLDLKNAEDVINFLEQTDAYRRPDRFFEFCLITNLLIEDSAQSGIVAKTLLESLTATKEIDTLPFLEKELKGEAISAAIHQARVERLKPKH